MLENFELCLVGDVFRSEQLNTLATTMASGQFMDDNPNAIFFSDAF